MEASIEPICFEDVLPIWSNHLWPSPSKTIRKASSLSFLGGWDLSIHKNEVTFLGCKTREGLAGVLSGFRTGADLYRCRGLWVEPEFRNRGIGLRLLAAIGEQALAENCSVLWSLPRKSSFSVYSKFGFVQRSDWFSEGMDFGPNCYASVELPRT